MIPRQAWLGTAAVVGVGVLAWPYTVDDAFIVARYAQNLVTGRGYALNPGQVSDGVTGPLWLLPQALALRLGLDPIAVAKLAGIACTAASVALVLARLRARTLGRAAAWYALVLLALSPSLGTWAASGLETGAATLLLTAAALAATRRRAPAALQLGACVGALAWLRPELALACAVLLAYAALRSRRAGLVAVVPAAIGTLALLVFRQATFHAWLPLSVAAKAGSLAFGLRYTLTALVLATSVVGGWLGYEGARRGRGGERALALVLLAHACALVLAGGDWMPGYRLLVPVLPLYAWLAAWGLVRAAQAPWVRAGLLATACAVPATDLVLRVPDLRAAGERQRAAAGLAERLRARARVVAMVDIGFLGYRSGVEVVDLGGLTDPEIAVMPGGHLDKHIDPAYLARRDPDALLLHAARPPQVSDDGRLLALSGYPVERRVAAMAFVRERFRVAYVERYAPGYYYVLLTARSGT